ncbi:MAG: beta-L-arabinofuranosidase domain-containing protein [Bacteroidales bacterium]|jgi:DUF1680 family protein
MKIKIIFAIIACMIATSCGNNKKTSDIIELPEEWKFITGDNPEYSNPGFNDQSWKSIKVDNYWEAQGYPGYDGFAWYRTRAVFPASLKNSNKLFKTVRITLGRIDDADETWLNGKKIGETDGWDVDRSYYVPFNLINWDKENVIAVRVYDRGGNGGMYGRPHSIGGARLSGILDLKTNDKPPAFTSKNSEFTKTLIFHFKTPVEKLRGNLRVRVYDPKNDKVVFQKDAHIVIGTKADTSYTSRITIKEPDTYKIEYVLTSRSLTDRLRYNTLFSYKPGNHMNEKFEYPVVDLTVPDKASPFGLENITFGGYLNERLNANLTQRLLNIDETGILECYYNRPGKQTWVGEYTGKYLHAASRVWRSTQNKQLKTQMDRIANILISCQNKDGYLGTYLPANYWTEWDVWAHKYNMLGLLSYYSVTAYKPALEACVKMGDLLCRTFGENKGQRSIIDNSPHIGMASTSILEPMTYLYRFTGDKKYLEFCKYIIKAYEYENGPKIISALTTLGKVDKTADAKAYEMMSNLTGIVKLYQLTGDEKLLKAADNAWKDIAANKLYITGTASKDEVFQEDFVLPAGNDVNMGEGCVTVTWLQFSQALYYLTGDPKYINEIEKTIYNHLFAAENPETGCVSYYTALQGKKPYRCNIDGHCCLASLPRGIAAVPELAYSKNQNSGFSINLYSTGKLTDKILAKNGKEVGIECNIESNFPQEGGAIITLNPETKCEFRLALHVPAWCRNYKANVNGRSYNGVPGQYLNIEQSWVKKTVITIVFDMPVQILDGGKSYPGYKAIKYGTQALAVDQSLNPEITDLDKLSIVSPSLKSIPKTLLPKNWVGYQIFSTKAFYNNSPVDLKLVPFADAGQTGGDIRVWIKKE